MAAMTSHRWVNLVDNRVADRPFISASVYRGFYAHQLEAIEASWAKAIEKEAERAQVAGLNPLEHTHWDWRNKADSVETGRHMLVAVESDDDVQGLMAILRLPCPARLGDGSVIYVDYLETAPWNLKNRSARPRFLGVGTVLVSEAVRISVEEGFEGRVGLHSLPQAEASYLKCGMARLAEDPAYYDLAYFQYRGRDGIDWLNSIGEST